MHNKLSFVKKNQTTKLKTNNKPQNTPGNPVPREMRALDSSGSNRMLIPTPQERVTLGGWSRRGPPIQQRVLPLAAGEPSQPAVPVTTYSTLLRWVLQNLNLPPAPRKLHFGDTQPLQQICNATKSEIPQGNRLVISR